jgi:calcium-dependent protein kinase
MVMEYMKGGALWKRIREGHYSERQAAQMMQCILRTVAQCHARNVVYRDVKVSSIYCII